MKVRHLRKKGKDPMDTEKFNTLTALVREAREDDARALEAMEIIRGKTR